MKTSNNSRSQQRNEIVKAATELCDVVLVDDLPEWKRLREAIERYRHPVKRRSIPQVSDREPVREYQDGIKKLPGGREKCMTAEGKQKRREEVWLRDDKQCTVCEKPLELHEAHIHHRRKRSLGRDDSVKNLVTLCPNCHRIAHETGRDSEF